jgi:hypothetical protein
VPLNGVCQRAWRCIALVSTSTVSAASGSGKSSSMMPWVSSSTVVLIRSVAPSASSAKSRARTSASNAVAMSSR